MTIRKSDNTEEKKKRLRIRGEKAIATSNEALKEMGLNSGGETNQKRKDFLWLSVLQ